MPVVEDHVDGQGAVSRELFVLDWRDGVAVVAFLAFASMIRATGFTRFDLWYDDAWSASPGYYLSKNVLGINFPNAPDLSLLEIKISSSSVTWAEGSWPHPEGAIHVKWRTEDAGRIIEVQAPEEVRVSIRE